MTGKLVVFCGPMYSEKSTGLVSLIRKATISKKKVVLFKPTIDDRYSDTSIVTHNGESLEANSVKSSQDIEKVASDFEVIGIDEVQFFDEGIIDVIQKLKSQNKDVIVAGLSTDFRGQPFEITARLAMLSNKVKKLASVCTKCNSYGAIWSQRIVDGNPTISGDRIQVGGLESYEPRCDECFERS